MKKHYIVLPKSFNYHNLIKKDLDRYKNLNINVVKGVLGLIVKRLAFKLMMEETPHYNPEHCQVRICASNLKQLFGNDYKLALELLHKNILFKYPYSEGKCFAFALNPKIVKGGFSINTICGDGTKDRNIINKFFIESKKVDYKIKKNFNFLIKFFNPEKLTIDIDGVKNELNTNPKYSNNIIKQLISYTKVSDLCNGNYHFSFDPETDGRFHNNFVRLNKDLRKYLKYDGKKLVEIDISNSIPFILSAILTKSIDIDNRYLSNDSIKLYNKLLSYMFPKTLECTENNEIELFHHECASGKLYESLMTDYVIEYEMDYIDENGQEHFAPIRKKVKKELLSMFFSINSHYKKMQKVFSKQYPKVLNQIQSVKRRYSKRFSHLLFQIESYIVLQKIARGFNNSNNGKTPIFTIHDCLITTEDNALKLHYYIEKELSKIFFLKKPQISLEYY